MTQVKLKQVSGGNISVTDAAKLKDCTRQTIYNNKDKLNWTPDNRIIADKKFKRFMPDKTKQHLRIVLDPSLT